MRSVGPKISSSLANPNAYSPFRPFVADLRNGGPLPCFQTVCERECVCVHASAIICYVYDLYNIHLYNLLNCLWEFHQIYNFGAVEDTGKLIRFEVEGQNHNETKCTFLAEA